MSVYFVVSHDDQYVKIGFAKSCKRRLQVLQTGCPTPLRLHHEIPEATREDEKHLHNLFASEHEHGEWFLWSPRISRWVERYALEHQQGNVRAGFNRNWTMGLINAG